ncbi:MAG: hypothetical protein HKN10_10385 [Myxococcales bacterium]|nr:hypothetical protein [Myxococcales bacterium]
MLSIYQGYAVSESLLEEVARTQWMVDPVLLCYSVCALVAFFVCTVAYLLVGRHGGRPERRARRQPSRHAAMQPRAHGAS